MIELKSPESISTGLQNRRNLALAVSALGLAAGVTLAVIQPWDSSGTNSASVGSTTNNGSTPVQDLAVANPPEPAHGAACPPTLPTAKALPTGVTGVVSQTCGNNLAITSYGLTGTANSDTRTKAPSTDLLASHPAATVQYIVSFPSPGGPPGWSALPEPVANDPSVTVSSDQLSDGTPVRTTSPVDGVGTYRVEWIKNGSYFQLLSLHGHTTEGITGVPLATLLSMANQIGR